MSSTTSHSQSSPAEFDTFHRNAPRPAVIIQRTHGLSALNLHELWTYRDLLIILAGRDVKLRYKQTVLGIVWVILQPLIAALIFAVIFGRFAKLPSDDSPYLLFVYSGMLPWNLFASSLQRAGNSLVSSSNLISKVYFPRILIPLASVSAVLIDFAVSLVVMLVFIVIYQVIPTWRIIALLFFLLLTIVSAIGVSLWLTGLNVYYRDFMHILPFIIQVWMYASPVAYATSIVPDKYHFLYSFNPAVAFIEGFRWALLGHSSLSIEMVINSTLISIILFISGIVLFRRIERGFADVI